MSIDVTSNDKYSKFVFDNDSENKRLRLLVILSPILIASFDNGKFELEYLKNISEKSKFPYGLYPNFFDNFDMNSYFKSYDDYVPMEDILLTSKNKIEFKINPVDKNLEKSMIAIIKGLILDDRNLNLYLDYFKEIRDDIVINGRRSIIANGIQGFYLSKYVVVWMIEICEFLAGNTDSREDIMPIYELAINLKTPRLIN